MIVSDGIFLDFSPAFDKMDHKVTKLHSMAIRDFLLQWIRNFLSLRKQQLVFEDAVLRPIHSERDRVALLNDMPSFQYPLMPL